MKFHHPLRAHGTVVAEHRVSRIVDKGEGRGALLTVTKSLFDKASGKISSTLEQTTFCRGEGGFAGQHQDGDTAPPRTPWDFSARPADLVSDIPTLGHQALIYRLTGDRNPLHCDKKSFAPTSTPLCHRRRYAQRAHVRRGSGAPWSVAKEPGYRRGL